MSTNNNNPVRKSIIWICILLMLLALPAIACDGTPGDGCQKHDIITGVCVDGNVSEPNQVNTKGTNLLCSFNDGSNPNWNEICN